MPHCDVEPDYRMANELLSAFIDKVPCLLERTLRKDCSELIDPVAIDLTGIDFDDLCTEEGPCRIEFAELVESALDDA